METDLIRTCQNCAVAKIRCHRSQLDGPCDRCRRLHKDCVFRPARRRLNPVPRESSRDALSSIEAKLDQLLSYHGADQPGPIGSGTTTPDVRDALDAGIVTPKAAEYYVELYKSSLTPHFPFVVLHPDVSAEQLRQEKPLLFLAVLTAAAYGDVIVQRELANRMRTAIADNFAGHGSMSFELLQALLVHLAWTQYHPRPRRYSQYLQLAISIIVDQRLNRPLHHVPWKTHVGSHVDEQLEQQTPASARSNEVQRAIAGCYYLSSTVSTLLQKLNTFQYTRYIGDCCRSLSANPEFSTDKYLHSIIQLQRSMESIDPYSATPSALPAEDNAVVSFSRIQMELDGLKSTMPFQLGENHLVFMLFHTVQLHAVQMRLFFSGSRPGASYDIRELDQGFSAAKSLFDFYLSLPLRKEMAFNNSEWLQLSFALTVAAKIVFAALDPAIADRTRDHCSGLDVSSILRQVLLRLGVLQSSAADNPGEPDVFQQYGQRVKRMQAWFEDRYARAQQAISSSPENQRVENDGVLARLSSGEGELLLLPELQSLEGMEAYDVQLATFFPDDLQMSDDWGDWAMYSNGF